MQLCQQASKRARPAPRSWATGTPRSKPRPRLAVASTSGDAALVDRSAELLEKLANMRIGSNKAEAAPNGDELAKVFQAMLRTT